MESKKARNVRELREFIGLNQEEFATLAGISAVYLSQIENGRRPMTHDVAEKIASAISDLCSDPPNSLFRLDPEELRIGHVASFCDDDLQKEIIERMENIETERAILNYILREGEIPDPDYANGRFGKGAPIELIIREMMGTVIKNVREFLIEYQRDKNRARLLSKDYYRPGERE